MKKIKPSFFLSGYKKNIYNIFSYFFICAFVGWVFETTVVLIQSGHITERGLLFINHNPGYYFPLINSIPVISNLPIIWGLPIIGIYGIGGCILVFTFGKLDKHPIILFFVGMIFMTIFELVSSYFCEEVLHKKYWDYTADFLNFQGRICLRSSLAWGVLSVLTIKLLKPKLELIYAKERRIRNYKILIIIVMAYTVICMLIKFVL